MPFLPDFSSDLFWTKFALKFSCALREKRIEPEVVAEVCGVATSTVAAWRKLNARPSVENVFRIMGLLGPEFTNELLSMIGLGGAEEIEPGHEVRSALRCAQAQLNRADDLLQENHRSEGEMQQVVGLTAELLYRISRIHKRITPQIDEMADRRVPRRVS